MILTYKIKHCRDFSTELRKAHQINGYNLKGGVTSIVGEIF